MDFRGPGGYIPSGFFYLVIVVKKGLFSTGTRKKIVDPGAIQKTGGV
jgi:hypothetical protein